MEIQGIDRVESKSQADRVAEVRQLQEERRAQSSEPTRSESTEEVQEDDSSEADNRERDT